MGDEGWAEKAETAIAKEWAATRARVGCNEITELVGLRKCTVGEDILYALNIFVLLFKIPGTL